MAGFLTRRESHLVLEQDTMPKWGMAALAHRFSGTCHERLLLRRVHKSKQFKCKTWRLVWLCREITLAPCKAIRVGVSR